MFRRKGLALLAACAALTCGSLLRAAEVSNANTTNTTNAINTAFTTPLLADDTASPATTAPAAEAAAAATPTLLMEGLDKIGVGKTLESANIAIVGYVEGSYTWDANDPPGGYFTGLAFDNESESVLLNQLDLNITRSVDASKGKFDVGGTIEQIYGADAALIHANGLTTYSPSKIMGAYTNSGTRQPKNQYDLTQAFLTFAVPVGKGLTITVGKFYTLMGYESTNPTANWFYSRNFLFTQLPITQTGLMAAYPLNDQWSVIGGFSRGWDQVLDDTNGSLDALGQVKYAKDKLTVLLNFTTGDEQASSTSLDGWRTVLDLVATYAYSDNLALGLNADYGIEPQVAAGGNTAQWYGVSTYGQYTINAMFAPQVRAEWFNDPDGAAPASFNPGTPNTYYELTLGVKIKPMPKSDIGSNLIIRPEVRLDYANIGTWVGSNSHDQFTAAIEAYFTF